MAMSGELSVEKSGVNSLVSSSTITRTVLYTMKERNPALAFSMSLLCWGGGQFYNRQRKLATMLVLIMLNYYMPPGSRRYMQGGVNNSA